MTVMMITILMTSLRLGSRIWRKQRLIDRRKQSNATTSLCCDYIENNIRTLENWPDCWLYGADRFKPRQPRVNASEQKDRKAER